MLLTLLLGLAWASVSQTPARLVETTSVQYERARDVTALATAIDRRQAHVEILITAALERRGHNGPKDYLQGCDLSDLQTDYDIANLELVAASPDWPAYHAAWRSTVAAGDHDDATEPSLASQIRRAAQADQQVRRRLSEPLPDGPLGEAVGSLLRVRLCEQDLANGPLVSSRLALDLFATTEDGTVLRDLYLLALHSDHQPRIQDAYGDIYLRRREAMGWPVESGLRLKDRSRINLGLPQLYATGILCEGGAPVVAGQVDMAAANTLRATLGLPPVVTEAMARDGFCG